MSGALLFVALSLACFRVWRFIGRDSITEPLRARFHGKLAELVMCEWCLGTWLSFGLVYVTHRTVVVLRPDWALWAMAVATVVGFLGTLDERLNR